MYELNTPFNAATTSTDDNGLIGPKIYYRTLSSMTGATKYSQTLSRSVTVEEKETTWLTLQVKSIRAKYDQPKESDLMRMYPPPGYFNAEFAE